MHNKSMFSARDYLNITGIDVILNHTCDTKATLFLILSVIIAKVVFASLAVAMILLELPSFVFGPIGSVQAEQGYSFDANCVSTECIKLKARLMCDNENELIPSYLDCTTILSCIDLEEQIKMYCAGGYSLTVIKT